MEASVIYPPKSMFEIWEMLPEGTRCELINNNLIMSPAPLDVHQVVLLDVAFNLKSYLNKSQRGEIRISPYDVHFSKQNILQPDLIFIKQENLYKIEKNGSHGSPDIIIEVLSPSTFTLDYGEKKSVYEKFGVPEYFIVNPDNKAVDAYFLEKGKMVKQSLITGIIQSKIFGTDILF